MPYDFGLATGSHHAQTGLTLLLVEDDLLCREVAIQHLSGLFTEVFVAADGLAGLQLFQAHPPDLVLSDQNMPGLSGLEMFHEIRAVDKTIPLILLTGYMNNATLLEAINLGVNRFIPKQNDLSILVRVVKEMIQELLDQRQLEQCRRQEMEVLRQQDRYNSMQQEAGRRKERHLARHDLRHRVITGAEGVRWGINVASSARDILCGDGYTIRNLTDGRQFIFLVDAMGSGLSAALTALLTTSFCNYQVGRRHRTPNFSLGIFLEHFQEYLAGILLDEETLSCDFLLLDLQAQEIEMAIFGMPPLLLRRLDGSTRSIRGANPPLSIYSNGPEIIKYSLAEVADLMLMTDGITDASIPGGGAYRERLEADFRASPTLASLLRRYRFHTKRTADDDLTLLHIQRLDLPAAWNWRANTASQASQRARVIDDFLTALTEQTGLASKKGRELVDLLQLALIETPGVGNPDPDPRHKAKPRFSASVWRGAEQPLLLIEIGQDGAGLLPDNLTNTHAETTWKTATSNCDSYFIDGPGSCMMLLTTIEGDHDYAH